MSDSNPYGIRRATPSDVDALLAFVPLVLAETEVLPLSVRKVRDLVERCASQRGAMAGIIDGPGRVDASVGLLMVDSDVSDEPYVKAAWWGLHPDARKMPKEGDKDPRAHYGSTLARFAYWCQKQMEEAAQAPILFRLDVLTTYELQPKIGFYQRQMTQIGASFAIGVKGRREFKPQDVAA